MYFFIFFYLVEKVSEKPFTEKKHKKVVKIRFFLKIIFYLLFLRNGIKVDSSYTTSGRDSSNTYSFLASTEDNNAKFRCESKNELSTEPLTAEIVLSVQCE